MNHRDGCIKREGGGWETVLCSQRFHTLHIAFACLLTIDPGCFSALTPAYPSARFTAEAKGLELKHDPTAGIIKKKSTRKRKASGAKGRTRKRTRREPAAAAAAAAGGAARGRRGRRR